MIYYMTLYTERKIIFHLCRGIFVHEDKAWLVASSVSCSALYLPELIEPPHCHSLSRHLTYILKNMSFGLRDLSSNKKVSSIVVGLVRLREHSLIFGRIFKTAYSDY